jgi:Tfp pilus assembly protein PilN
MRAVNLLPRATNSGRRKAGFDRVLAVGIAITVLVTAALAGGFFLEKAHAGTERQRLAAAQRALAAARAKLPATRAPAPAQLQTPVVLSQAEPWHLALDAALASRVSWDVLLSQLEYVVPARVVLTSVTLGGTAGATGGTVSLGGSAYSMHDIGVFLSTLTHVPKLSQVTLVSSAANTGAKKVVTFQITAQAALPAALVAPATADMTTTTTGG